MNVYILVSLVVLGVIALLYFMVRRNQQGKRLTPLAGLAFGFILAGTLFSDNQMIGYSLLGIGVILAVVDLVIGLKRR